MAKRLEELAKAPDFTLTDTRGAEVCLSDYCGQPVVLLMLRGFM